MPKSPGFGVCDPALPPDKTRFSPPCFFFGLRLALLHIESVPNDRSAQSHPNHHYCLTSRFQGSFTFLAGIFASRYSCHRSVTLEYLALDGPSPTEIPRSPRSTLPCSHLYAKGVTEVSVHLVYCRLLSCSLTQFDSTLAASSFAHQLTRVDLGLIFFLLGIFDDGFSSPIVTY